MWKVKKKTLLVFRTFVPTSEEDDNVNIRTFLQSPRGYCWKGTVARRMGVMRLKNCSLKISTGRNVP